MKIKKAQVIYTLLCNLPVSFMLTLTAQLIADPVINWMLFLLNFAVGYGIATLVGLFFPLVQLGKWFTAQFDIDTITYTGNMFYRLTATFIITMVFFIFVSPSLTILNHFLFPGTLPIDSVLLWCKMALPLILIGYATSLIADYVAYHIAHRVDPTF